MKNLNKAVIVPLIGALVVGSAICASPALNSKTADAATDSYTTYINPAVIGSGLNIEPSVIYNVDSEEDLNVLSSASIQPAVSLLTVDENMDVVLGNETQAFKTVFNTYVRGKSIPALRIESDEVADAFIEYMTDTYYIADIIVVSTSDDILGKIYDDEVTYIANSVLDVSDVELSENRYDFWEYIAAANTVGANILLIDGESENAGGVANYAAALNKVCWGTVSDNTLKAVGTVAAGCYGLVGENLSTMQNAIKAFGLKGFSMSQQVAAHRGITKYANENSLTSCAAAANEGATHIEIDVQVTVDGEILLCHNADAGSTSDAPSATWFANLTSSVLRNYTLNDYDESYDETFATLDELIEVMLPTDVIFIVELKLDGASDNAVAQDPVQSVYDIMSSYEEMTGRWIAITFYGKYAQQMREIAPEIPVCCLGWGVDTGYTTHSWGEVPSTTSVGSVSEYIKFNRRLNVGLDYYQQSTTYTSVQQYLARGYLQNAWTYENTDHAAYGVNIATTNKAEEMAMQVKNVGVGTLEIAAEELESGMVNVLCETYNGFVKAYDCSLVYIDGTVEAGETVNVVLHYQDDNYGIYSSLLQVKVK